MIKKMSLILLVLIVVFAGCSAPEAVKKEPAVFSVLFNNTAANPFKSDWLILSEYKKLQNVQLDVKLGDNENYGKVLTQTFESGDIPDIVLKCWPNEIESYATNGLLLPFSDYENLMPNFMAYIKKNNLQSELDKLKLKNGKYYILPGYQRDIQVQQWMYRKDLFVKNNLAMPKTYDELLESLVTLKKLYPKTTPITACWSGAHLFAMMGAGYGIPAGWNGTRYYNEKENVWQFAPATENYKQMLTFLNRCYKAEVMDPEIFTQTDAEYYAKIEDGRALATVTWITSGFKTWNDKLKANGVDGGEWAALPVPESTIGIKALPAVDKFRKGLVVPASAVSKPYFNDLIKFLDWAVYSEEGMTLTTWGVEGVTYKNTADGKVYLQNIKTPKNTNGTIDISNKYGFGLLFDLNENVAFEDYKKPPEIVEFLNDSQKNKETLKISPNLILDSQETKAAGLINEKLDPFITETGRKFITGELSVQNDWAAYLQDIEDRGYKTLETVWNTAWATQK